MRLLDLFCGAGGCSVGYHRAGFTKIVGVDSRPQPRYPFEFVQADAMEYLAIHGHQFDAIHASPPCQKYSRTQAIWGREYVDLLPSTRALLEATGKPYVIENVEEAPMGGIILCGGMFGLHVYRHRRFETSHLIFAPFHPLHRERVVATGCPVAEGQLMTVAGNYCNVKWARQAMGVDWMSKKELAQAIPPAYTEFIGKQLLRVLH
jgi:DNA (cytosine-5)-methyltransferase 1